MLPQTKDAVKSLIEQRLLPDNYESIREGIVEWPIHENKGLKIDPSRKPEGGGTYITPDLEKVGSLRLETLPNGCPRWLYTLKGQTVASAAGDKPTPECFIATFLEMQQRAGKKV